MIKVRFFFPDDRPSKIVSLSKAPAIGEQINYGSDRYIVTDQIWNSVSQLGIDVDISLRQYFGPENKIEEISYYSDATLGKVRASIARSAPHVSTGTIDDIINALLNDGILFRERHKD